MSGEYIEVANSTKMVTTFTNANIEEVLTIPEWDDDLISEDLNDDIAPETTEKRHFYATSIISSNSPKLPLYLISVLLKMYYSPHDHVQLVDPNRAYIQLDETSWTWVNHFNKNLQFGKVN